MVEESNEDIDGLSELPEDEEEEGTLSYWKLAGVVLLLILIAAIGLGMLRYWMVGSYG